MMHAMARHGTGGRLLICLLAAVFAAGPAQAQRREAVDIPYSFTVTSQQYPAGRYTISLSAGWLIMQPGRGAEIRRGIITRLNGPNAFLQAGSLVFDNTDGKHILSEVWLPGEDGALVYKIPNGHRPAVLSFTELDPNGHASGKTAYQLTCARCHGNDGRGNVKADQYFGTSIPRLASAGVQQKSDAELREIIASGTKTMPPVEVEEAGFRHRLPSQHVEAVIAYLRTLNP